jgi:hypothetical protein
LTNRWRGEQFRVLPNAAAERLNAEMAARLHAALVLLLLPACGLPGAGAPCTTQIDWVDFIRVGNIQYVAAPGSPITLQQSDLGPVVAHVKFKLAGNVCDPNYRLKDGDTGFLEPGTAVYQVKGRPVSEVLAAGHAGSILAYQAMAP